MKSMRYDRSANRKRFKIPSPLNGPRSPRVCLRGRAGKAVESNSLTACSHFASAKETALAWVGAPEPFGTAQCGTATFAATKITSGTATLFCFAHEASKKRPQPGGS